MYLDYAATSPVDDRVKEVMEDMERRAWGNPSSGHAFGRIAANELACATERLASLIKISSKEILYTSGATESNALVMTSLARLARHRPAHVVMSAFEHASVFDWRDELTDWGVSVSIVEPDKSGIVSVDTVSSKLRPDTVAVSLMAVQNELGTVQPIVPLSELLRSRGILLHTDATQATGRIPIADVVSCADLVVLSGHKCHGPKGIGALVTSPSAAGIVRPLFQGGGQQAGLRSGTISVPLVAGFVEAIILGEEVRSSIGKYITALENVFVDAIRVRFPDVELLANTSLRVPGIMSLRFPGVGADRLLSHVPDVLVSNGSACHSGAWVPSRAYQALGLSDEAASECIRVCVGRKTITDEAMVAGKRLGHAAARLQKREQYG